MTQICDERIGSDFWVAPHCANDVGCHKCAIVCFDFEVLIFFSDNINFAVKTQVDAILLSQSQKTVNNGLTRVRDRKHSAIRLCFEADALFFKPINCVSWIKFVKNLPEFLRSAGIVGEEFVDVETMISDVAAATTGDAHFC